MTSLGNTSKPGSTLSRATTAPGALSTLDIARVAKDADRKRANLFFLGELGQGKGYSMKNRLVAAMKATSTTTNGTGK